MRIGFLVASIVLIAVPGWARTFDRYVHSCEYQLSQEDLVTARAARLGFKTYSFITLSSNGLFLKPKVVIEPDNAMDPIAWGLFEARIRGDIESGAFSYDQFRVRFDGVIKLNYDGFYDLVKVMGGTRLEYSDDLTVDSFSVSGPESDGRYAIETSASALYSNHRSMQLHLPMAVKDGLSFHVNWTCEIKKTGVY